MNARTYPAQNKMRQYPEMLDFAPTASQPLSSSVHVPFSQHPDSTPSTPGILGWNGHDNGVAPILSLEKDLCSDYSCCGLQLADMHQLLDHFEEAHVLVLGGDGRPVHSSLNDNAGAIVGASPAAFVSSSVHALGGGAQPGLSSLVMGYPQPYPPADAPFQYPTADSNFALTEQPSPLTGAPESSFDVDFMSEPQQPSQASFDPFAFDFDFDGLHTRSSSPSASSTFSSPSLTWSDSSLSPASSNTSFNFVPIVGQSASSRPGSSYSSSRQASPVIGANGDMESICLPPALFTIQSQTLPSSLPASARSSPVPMSVAPAQQRSAASKPQAKEAPADAEESRDKEKRTAVGKIKAKIFGNSARKSKSDGYKKRDPRREKAYKCSRPGCIKAYLNPNGLKYHLEKGTCIIDPMYRLPSVSPRPHSQVPTAAMHGQPVAGNTRPYYYYSYPYQYGANAQVPARQ